MLCIKTSGIDFQMCVMLVVILVVLQLVTFKLRVGIGWWQQWGSICIDRCTVYVIVESRD